MRCCDTLQLEGYVTEGFSSAHQALAELRPGKVDLLLTDLMMPEMDGISLIEAARQIDPTLGAIVMTGHGTIDTAVQAMRGGALDYILKPFKLNVILPVIARALDVQRLRREVVELRELERRRSEELAAAYHDLESFSYSISHDLRAPLRAIDGFSQILEDDFAERLGEDGGRIVRIIRAGSQKMDQLIVALLEFSRAGSTALHREAIDMTLLAQAAANEARSLHTGPEPLIEIGPLPALRWRCHGHAPGVDQSHRQRAEVQRQAVPTPRPDQRPDCGTASHLSSQGQWRRLRHAVCGQIVWCFPATAFG